MTVLGAGIAVVLTYLYTRKSIKVENEEFERKARQVLEDSNRKAEEIKREATEQAKEIEKKAREQDRELKERRAEQQKQEDRLLKREENFERKQEFVTKREEELNRRATNLKTREEELDTREGKLSEFEDAAHRKLEQVAGLSSEEAKKQLMNNMVEEARLDAARAIKQLEDETKENAAKKAKGIIALAIQRYAGEYVTERTVSVVNLPSDDMKGRIIGREGRNIRAFEAATGIDLIIDDTPEAVILSGFNPVRREVARISLEKLITDGRIHPTRIEEVVEKTSREIEQAIKEAGEFAVFELGLHSMNIELIKILGRLKYRTSYAQNNLMHSIEVGFLCGLMAAELRMNVKLARRAGLLHDIGKAVDHDVEGSHAVIGANLAKKYGESPEIIHAIAAHHEDEKPQSVLAHLVAAADALSGARPGARREMLESYIQRIEDLENISRRFPGVEKTFAIQAGREVRVLVENSEVSDEGAVMLSRDIAKAIEEELTYPGQIKITVIREMRAIDYAR